MNEDFKHLLATIDNEVYLTANKFHLTNEEIEPITDGVGDPDLFLTSKLNTTWICKEPHDEKDDHGQPCGGGWSLTRDCFMKNKIWPVPAWQRVIYIMYGVKYNLTYNQMDYIRDDPEMGEVLREVPWINISKMPGLTNSYADKLKEDYKIWKDIIRKQIELFNTRIVIFAGTFEICATDYIKEAHKPIEKIQVDWVKIEVYNENGKIFINAPHPGFRYKNVEPYVNTIINLIIKYK